MRCLFRWPLLAALLLSAGPAWADLERGMAAVEKRDWSAALGEFQPLAEKGDPEAQVNLGNLYMKGYGVEQDYSAALRWYLKAAKQDSAVAQGKLGLLHYYGLGVRENHAEAAGWFRQAADQGDAGAAAILGSLHAEGDGVEKDKVQAYFWYTVAADRGHPEARDGRDALVDEMSPGEINESLSRLAAWRRQHEPAVEAGPEEPVPTPSGKAAAGAQGKKAAKGKKPAKAGTEKPPKPSGKAASSKLKKDF